jgi:glycosyltransferase involved in cell wall biosynthesis
VSVVIPTYNQEQFIVAAVESALAQTFEDLEVLVVDDGSCDNTADLVSCCGEQARYIRQKHGGQAAARNRGIRESRGTYVAFLDGDDVWMSEKLERQMTELGRSELAGACYCAFRAVDELLHSLWEQHSYPAGDLLESLLFQGNVIGIPSSVVVHKDLLNRVGSFDPGLGYCCDWDLWIRLARQTQFVYIDEPLVCWRQHGSNLTRQVDLLERDSVALLRKALRDAATPAHLRARASRAMSRNWMVLAGSYFGARRYSDFVRCATRAILLDPAQAFRLLSYPIRRLRGGSGSATVHRRAARRTAAGSLPRPQGRG